MHVLWLIPDGFSFLVEELEALTPLVDRLSVFSFGPRLQLPNITSLIPQRDKWTPVRLAYRAGHLIRASTLGSRPRRRSDFASWRRVAAANEQIARFVCSERVDVVHSHFAVPDGTAGWQACCGRPVILTLRGVDILTLPQCEYGFMLDDFYRRNLLQAFARVARITVGSHHSKVAALHAGAPAHKLRLIPNGVNLCRFRRSAEAAALLRSRLALGDRPIVAAAGNLVPGKGFDILLQAMRIVLQSTGEAVLIVAGDGPERPALAALAAELGISTSVVFPGRLSRAEMNGLLSAAAVFAHASLSEGFGNVILEAMAAECPVVATATGAAPDIIVDGVSGRLVPLRDVDALASAIADSLYQRDKTHSWAKTAMATVQAGYSLERRAAQFVAMYKDIESNESDTLPVAGKSAIASSSN